MTDPTIIRRICEDVLPRHRTLDSAAAEASALLGESVDGNALRMRLSRLGIRSSRFLGSRVSDGLDDLRGDGPPDTERAPSVPADVVTRPVSVPGRNAAPPPRACDAPLEAMGEAFRWCALPAGHDGGHDWQRESKANRAAARSAGPAPDDVRRLLGATRRGPVPFADLCDALDLSPAKCRALIDRAQSDGFAVSVDHGEVSFRLPEGGGEHHVDVAPATSGPHMVGVISDVHFGSKHCLRAQLRDFVDQAYARGVRHILSPGDWLDGVYRHSLYEQSHRGFDEQADDAFESLPARPGLVYHFIDGNHDDTLSDAIGMESGRALVERFKARGRDDLRFYGRRGAYLRIFGARVELWHPRSGKSYALSYQLQNHIRDYAVGQKPDILLAGHWHIWTYFEQRGVHALACGTFQGGGSAFGKSLGGAPSMGGTILSWELTDHGTIRRFAVERSAYYEHEHTRDTEAA